MGMHLQRYLVVTALVLLTTNVRWGSSDKVVLEHRMPQKEAVEVECFGPNGERMRQSWGTKTTLHYNEQLTIVMPANLSTGLCQVRVGFGMSSVRAAYMHSRDHKSCKHLCVIQLGEHGGLFRWSPLSKQWIQIPPWDYAPGTSLP